MAGAETASEEAVEVHASPGGSEVAREVNAVLAAWPVVVPAVEAAVQEEVVADRLQARSAEAVVGSAGAWDRVADLEAVELDVVRVDSAEISAVARGLAVPVLGEQPVEDPAKTALADRVAVQGKADQATPSTGRPAPEIWLVIDPRLPAAANLVAFSGCPRTRDYTTSVRWARGQEMRASAA